MFYVQNPSGMATLARRLRGRKGPTPSGKTRLSATLLTEVGKALRHRQDEAVTPQRILLATAAAAAFRDATARLTRLRRRAGLDLVMAYSIKTSPAPELLGMARDAGLWAEAIAQTEVAHALRLGFPARHVVLNGPGKWWPGPVPLPAYGAVFCDSLEELHALHPRVKTGRLRTDTFGIRLRPATVNSRFGIGLHEPETLTTVLARLAALPKSQGLGFHFHIASSMVGVRTWLGLADNFLAAVGVLCERVPDRSVTLSFGGGWHPDDWTPFLEKDLPRLVATCERRLPMVRRIILEPGKALAQASMCVTTRVLEVRRRREATELVVDASIAELPDVRSHPHHVVSRKASGTPAVWGPGRDRILGRLCMEFDILSDDVQVPRGIKAGDLVAYLNAGAYDASMAYHFGRGDAARPA